MAVPQMVSPGEVMKCSGTRQWQWLHGTTNVLSVTHSKSYVHFTTIKKKKTLFFKELSSMLRIQPVLFCIFSAIYPIVLQS